MSDREFAEKYARTAGTSLRVLAEMCPQWEVWRCECGCVGWQIGRPHRQAGDVRRARTLPEIAADSA